MTLDYFFIILCALTAGTLFIVLSFESKALVSGQSNHFSKEIILYALIVIVPSIIFMISCALSIYKIRHLANPVGCTIAYVVLMLVSWLGFFPLHQIFSAKLMQNLPPLETVTSNSEISKGYFRTTSTGTHYYLEDSTNHVAPVVTLNNKISPNDSPKFQNIDITEETKPFNDPLIKNTMGTSPNNLSKIFIALIRQSQNYWKNGYLAWLCFCSLGFALGSCYCFIRFSSWRLINMFLCIISTLGILFFNMTYFSPALDSFRSALYSIFYGHGLFAGMVRREIDVPLFFLNMITGTLFTAAGFIISAVRNKRGN